MVFDVLCLDLRQQMLRRSVPYKEPVFHPQKTVAAMRLLCAISDHATRVGVSHNLYKVRMAGCWVVVHCLPYRHTGANKEMSLI